MSPPVETTAGKALLRAGAYLLLPSQEEAYARLQFAIEQRLGLAILFGPTGTGKSWLLNGLAEQGKRQGEAVAKVSLCGKSPVELLWSLLAGWGANPPAEATVERLGTMVHDHLASLSHQRRAAVLLLDDFSSALPTTLMCLQGVVSSLAAHGRANGLTIIAAADSLTRARIPAWWLERAELRADLETLTVEETRGVLNDAAVMDPAAAQFTDEAIASLQSLTQGLPRRVEQLQRLVLIAAGEGSSEGPIDTATVEQVYRELYVVPKG